MEFCVLCFQYVFKKVLNMRTEWEGVENMRGRGRCRENRKRRGRKTARNLKKSFSILYVKTIFPDLLILEIQCILSYVNPKLKITNQTDSYFFRILVCMKTSIAFAPHCEHSISNYYISSNVMKASWGFSFFFKSKNKIKILTCTCLISPYVIKLIKIQTTDLSIISNH